MSKLKAIYGEMSKAKRIQDEAKSTIEELKDQYRTQLVEECVDNLFKIQETEGPLSKRDLEIFIGHLTHDVRNLYIER